MNIKTNKPKHTNRNTNLAIFSIENFLRKVLLYDRSGKSGEEDRVELINFYYKWGVVSWDRLNLKRKSQIKIRSVILDMIRGDDKEAIDASLWADIQADIVETRLRNKLNDAGAKIKELERKLSDKGELINMLAGNEGLMALYKARETAFTYGKDSAQYSKIGSVRGAGVYIVFEYKRLFNDPDAYWFDQKYK